MSDFFSYLTDHWYLIPIFIVLIALTVFMWVKAIVSGQKRKEEREKIIAQLEKEKALRNQFRVIVEGMFFDKSIDDERLVFGIAANIQMSIEKLDNMNEVFLSLSEVKQNVYALSYVFEDSKYISLSDFFNANGEPLTTIANRAAERIIGGEFSVLFSKMFAMFDDNDETVSFDVNEIAELDNSFCEFMRIEKDIVLKTAADYIRVNYKEFL